MLQDHDRFNDLIERLDAATLVELETFVNQTQTRLYWNYWGQEALRNRIKALLQTDEPEHAARLARIILKTNRGCFDLRRVGINGLPDSLQAPLQDATKLILDETALITLPAWVFTLPKLTEFSLQNAISFESLPELTQENTSLTKLTITNAKIKELPSSISSLQALETLHIEGCQLKELPASICSISSLKELILPSNKLKALPDQLGDLHSLNRLDLTKNQLSALPASLHSHEALEHLLLKQNKLTTFPHLVLSLDLKTIEGLPGYQRSPKSGQLSKFIKKLKATSLDYDARHRVFEIFDEDYKSDSYEMIRHLEAQEVDLDTIRPRAINLLLKWEGRRYEDRPLQPGSTVCVLGKTALKKTEIKGKLQAAKLNYSPSLNAQVTHVVINPGARDYTALPDLDCAHLSEAQLIDYLNAFEDHFLLEKDEDTAQSIESLSFMLQSVDVPSQLMALDMIDSGGLPAELSTELFTLLHLSDDKKVKDKLRKIVKVQGSKKLQDAFADRSKLISTSNSKVEKTFATNLSYYKSKHGQIIDIYQVAQRLIERIGRGLRFVLETLPKGDPRRAAALTTILKGGDSLDLYESFATYLPDYLNPYSYYDAFDFPPEILDFTHLTSLNARGCNISALPDDIDRLANLQQLNMSHNMLKTLPESFANLKQLKQLNLDHNQLTAFPDVLAKMPWLETITILNNRHDKQVVAAHPTDLQRAALPNTKITTI
jgi:Leucine-rich repeat (LRR) protein